MCRKYVMGPTYTKNIIHCFLKFKFHWPCFLLFYSLSLAPLISDEFWMHPWLKTTAWFFKDECPQDKEMDNVRLVSLVAEQHMNRAGLVIAWPFLCWDQGGNCINCGKVPLRVPKCKMYLRTIGLLLSYLPSCWRKIHLPTTRANVNHDTVYLSLHCIFNLNW